MPIYNSVGGITGLTIENDPSALKLANNLSDLPNLTTARTNLQLSTYFAALSHNHSGTYAPVSHNHSGTYAPVSHTHPVSDVTDWGSVSGASNGYVLSWNGSAIVWVAQSGGGSGISDAPSNGNLYARQNAAWTAFSVTPSVTNIDLTGNFNGYSMGSGNYTFKFDSSANTLRMQDGAGSGITISPTGITFPNSSVLTAGGKSVNAISGAYTLALSDANNIIYADISAGGGMPYTITVPEDSTTNFPVGTVISFVANAGATVTFSPSGFGPFIWGTTSFAGGNVHQAFLTKVAADTWILK